jgi:hypothetical protein
MQELMARKRNAKIFMGVMREDRLRIESEDTRANPAPTHLLAPEKVAKVISTIANDASSVARALKIESRVYC